MYQRSSRKRQIIARTLIYAFMTLSVLGIVSVLMLVILGYSFNRQDGRIEQGGLLQFASIPSGATVTLDDTQLGTLTPSKASVDAKDHNVQMNLTGYRTWQKAINVHAGGIGWLSYARLVPTTIKPESLRTFSKLAGSLASYDRKWIMIQDDAASPALTLANIESETTRYSTVTIPSTILTPAAQPEAPQVFTLDSWSNDDGYMLVKRTYDTDKTEWLSVDRAHPDKTVNLTTMFAVNASNVIFGSNNGRDLYIQTDDIVRKINLDAQTLSRPLASNVDTFSIFDNTTVVYVTKPDTAHNNDRHVGYVTDSMSAAETIWSYPEATASLHVAFGEYYGKQYVAVTHDTTLDLFSGTLPRGTTKANLRPEMSSTLTAPATYLSISRNGRFAVAQLPDGYTTYDIELQKTDSTVFKQPAVIQRKLPWLDDYIILSDRGNMLRFYEFDGSNQQDIMPVIEGQAASLSNDNKYLYGFVQTKDGISLDRAKLIIQD
jgi:hypothetical protein